MPIDETKGSKYIFFKECDVHLIVMLTEVSGASKVISNNNFKI